MAAFAAGADGKLRARVPQSPLARSLERSRQSAQRDGGSFVAWSPDGATLAIVRDLGQKDQIEYPIGKVLHTADGYLNDVRVSPDEERALLRVQISTVISDGAGYAYTYWKRSSRLLVVRGVPQ